MTQLAVTLKNDVAELERVVATVSQFATENALDPALVPDLNVVLEELITNTIFYGLPEGADPESLHIDLKLEREAGKLCIRLEDNGKAFDPTKVQPPRASILDRPVGGLGIQLVRGVMDTVSYTRQHGSNHLVMNRTAGPRKR